MRFLFKGFMRFFHFSKIIDQTSYSQEMCKKFLYYKLIFPFFPQKLFLFQCLFYKLFNNESPNSLVQKKSFASRKTAKKAL